MKSQANLQNPPTTIPVWKRLDVVLFAITLITAGPMLSFPLSLPESVVSCAPCHHQPKSNQIGEWLASSYSAVAGGLSCTDCHDTPCRGVATDDQAGGRSRFFALESLRAAVRLTLASTRVGDEIEAEISITNLGAGHLLPTGPAERRLILEVTARDSNMASLRLSVGSRLSLIPGDAKGTAGKTFGGEPLSQGLRVRERPLAPFATDVSRYRFAVSGGWPVLVSARLLLSQTAEKHVEVTQTSIVCRGPGPKP